MTSREQDPGPLDALVCLAEARTRFTCCHGHAQQALAKLRKLKARSSMLLIVSPVPFEQSLTVRVVACSEGNNLSEGSSDMPVSEAR
jgi:hypothetical protein